MATEKDDHFMVVVEVKIREHCGVPTFRREPQIFDRRLLKDPVRVEAFLQALDGVLDQPWEMEAQSHLT